MKRILIIGGVAAGATAAARARRLDNQADITILEAGEDVSFANCGLPYYLGGEIPNRSSLILASPETFDDQYQVKVHTGTEAIKINKEAHTVTTFNKKKGEQTDYSYDKLILAQGGKPVTPPLPGVEKDHVFKLWTLEDMDHIDSFIAQKDPQTAVVVGGGFIGLEMVEALSNRGMKVSLVEKAPQIMINLESEISGFLTEELLSYGVDIHVNKGLSEIKDHQVILDDKSKIEADMVLLSIGVRPTLGLAQEAGLTIGESGGLWVNEYLQTSDSDIYAAGDINEISHRLHDKKIRIPLAGPANRQGRIAAENALGRQKSYKGAMGSSIVKLFDASAGSTGLSLTQAKDAGYEADAVVVHKASYTAYYPGSQKVTLMLIYDKKTGKVLGAQSAGYVGIDKRLDVIATAIAGNLSIEDLEELDLAYAPPFNSPNGPVNMAAFTAVNKNTGFSPSLLAKDVEDYLIGQEAAVIDLRDPISFNKAHLEGSNNLSQNMIRQNMDQIPKDQAILLISEDGQKGHVALRMLHGAGYGKVVNLSGGYLSLERQQRVKAFEHLQVGLFSLPKKEINPSEQTEESEVEKEEITQEGPLVVDVRTPGEYAMGAYPGAVSIPLDELQSRASELGDKDRHIILYCASGARSSYGQRVLMQMGFSQVENGGGLHDMMARA
ncbi:FAD-dependent oxidoreductase [Spirochaeta cellobiosiphila]|uniref:FAD-dependent oxidoreductase n=1 Tax=Spirochaeta cellobiosiphila TaxID=504483 RepID=UPI000400A1E5|nr:FAD-dependent oxidoreductase [Spirochaeta cellobiosiphila]